MQPLNVIRLNMVLQQMFSIGLNDSDVVDCDPFAWIAIHSDRLKIPRKVTTGIIPFHKNTLKGSQSSLLAQTILPPCELSSISFPGFSWVMDENKRVGFEWSVVAKPVDAIFASWHVGSCFQAS